MPIFNINLPDYIEDIYFQSLKKINYVYNVKIIYLNREFLVEKGHSININGKIIKILNIINSNKKQPARIRVEIREGE